MTIKWVQVDPLVMNGEPFCYGSRLTVRQLLELRSNGFDLPRLSKDHPELKRVGKNYDTAPYGIALAKTSGTLICIRYASSYCSMRVMVSGSPKSFASASFSLRKASRLRRRLARSMPGGSLA